MTRDEITAFVANIATVLKIPFANYQFREPQEPPYLVYLLERDDFSADNSNYQKIVRLILELYTDNLEPEMEEGIESLLPSFYIKDQSYIDSERMYQTTYEIEVILNG